MTRKTKQNKNRSRGNRNNKSAIVSNVAYSPNKLYAETFPRTMKVTLKYSETRAFTTTGSVNNNDYVYNLNSIYDPNRTGTGHQPQGHDIWTGMYNRYRVDGCKVTINFVGSTAGYGTTLCLVPSNDATSIADLSTAIESPRALHKLYSQGGPALKMTKNYDLPEITGVTRRMYDDDDRYSAVSSNSPTEIIVLHVCIAELNYSAVPVSYVIEMDFYTTFFDPFQAGQS